MKTGAELKARRLELGITQHDLAGNAGISRTQLSRIENGKIEASGIIIDRLIGFLGADVLNENHKQEESELTINDIQVGDELECINADAYIKFNSSPHNQLQAKAISFVGLKVSYIFHDMVVDHNERWVHKDCIKYFRKKTKLQFSDLEVGDYVYVRDDLVDGKMYGECSWHDDMQKCKRLKIEEIECGGYINDDMVYTPEMIDLSRSMKKEDYLKMNEKEIASFEELQYVANKALDESIIEKYEVCIGHYGNKNMIIHFDGKFTEYSDNSTNSGIEFIQSLYTEEFIIECKDDCKKIKQMAEITFINGNSVVMDQPPSDDGIVRIWNDGRYDFTVLKGATVKQSIGDK